MEKSKVEFSIGEDLYGISIHELEARILILRDEISRIDSELDKKKRERSDADNLFGGSR